MSILSSIDRCVSQIPVGLVTDKIFYVELGEDKLEEIKAEISAYADMKLSEENIKDIGRGIVMFYNGYKIVLVPNKKKIGLSNFYIAFKTDIL